MKRICRGILYGLLCVLAGACILAGADAFATAGRIHHGVHALGVDLSRLHPEAARALLARAASGRLSQALTLRGGEVAPEYVTVLSPSDYGAEVDVESTVAKAAGIGRSGSALSDLVTRLRLWVQPTNIMPSVSLRSGPLEQALDGIAVAIEKLARDASLEVGKGGVEVVAAEDGVVLDRRELEKRLLTAVQTGETDVTIPAVRVPPSLSTEEVQAALGAATLFISAPVRLIYRDYSCGLSTNDLCQIADFFPQGVTEGRPLTVDTEEGRALLSRLLAPVERTPVDARIVPGDDDRFYEVIPSEEGVQVDWDALVTAVDQVALRREQRVVAVPVRTWAPKLTTLDATLLGARRVVASYTTFFSPTNEARANNIRQVATALDGRLIRPGEVFSFNGAVGPRTQAAGYDFAPVISKGVLTSGVGGGICQVSTTLFNAVLLAGLPVVERWPHAFFIEGYPLGRDATVSFGSEDFRFKNDSESLILLNCTAGEGWVEVTLSCADLDRQVEITVGSVRNVTPPRSSRAYPRIVVDPALAPGERTGIEEGIDGRTITVTRTVYDAGGRLLFQDEFTSVYAAKDWLVRVGT